MKKALLIVIIFNIFNNLYANSDVCKKISNALKSSQLIYNKYKDIDNALLILNKNVYSIKRDKLHYKSCDNNLIQEYISTYSTYITKKDTSYYNKLSALQYLNKNYPNNITVTKNIADISLKEYSKSGDSKMKKIALKNYKKYLQFAKTNNIKIDKKIYNFVKSAGLIKVKSTWGDKLIKDSNIPIDKYKAFYFDTRNPKKIIFSEEVKDISINYPFNQFHNIDSGHFAGYWVGYKDFKKDTNSTIYTNLSNSKVRIIVDGYQVYKGSHSAELSYNFKKGKHKIEVEFLNGWHTTELNVKILPNIKKLNLNKIKKLLSISDIESSEFWYAGVYESSNRDSTITLKIKKSTKPIVLLLQSYRAVNWIVSNPNNTDIKYVVVNSYSPIATVNGIDNSKIIYSKDRVASGYKLKRTCSCDNGYFNCESDIFNGYSPIAKLFNKKIRGFSGKYRAKEFNVPTVVMDDKIYKKIEQDIEEQKKAQKRCTKNKTVDFDSVMQ